MSDRTTAEQDRRFTALTDDGEYEATHVRTWDGGVSATFDQVIRDAWMGETYEVVVDAEVHELVVYDWEIDYHAGEDVTMDIRFLVRDRVDVEVSR